MNIIGMIQLASSLAQDGLGLMRVDLDLSIAERQHLVRMECERRFVHMKQTIGWLLFSMETSLLLLLFHMETYLRKPSTEEKVNVAMEAHLSQEDQRRLRQDAQTMLLQDLERIERLPLVKKKPSIRWFFRFELYTFDVRRNRCWVDMHEIKSVS